MNRRVVFVTGIAGALALALSGTTVNAQRGGGASHGRPATAGNPGHGRPATTGSPAGKVSHQPGTTKADRPRDSHQAKPTGTSGGRTVSDQLARNTALATRLQGILPAGTNLQEASAGFKNLGQFVAAAHVSRNLDIPFESLKGRMTGANAVSLGQAIHELKPTVDAKAEQQKAERMADTEIRAAEKDRS